MQIVRRLVSISPHVRPRKLAHVGIESFGSMIDGSME
jgi:hypothetical protein